MFKIILFMWALWALAFSASSTMVAIRDQDFMLMVMSAPSAAFNLVALIMVLAWVIL